MKKSSVIFLIPTVSILIICSILFIWFVGNQPDTKKEVNGSNPLLARNGEYALLAVGDTKEITTDLLRQHGVQLPNLHKITRYDSIDEIQNSLPETRLRKTPAYVIFDSKEPIYITNDFSELINYLKSIEPNQ